MIIFSQASKWGSFWIKGTLFLAFLTSLKATAVTPTVCLQEQKIPSMGTFFEIQVINNCKKPIQKEVFIKVKDILDQLESEMSLYQSQSPISQLNQSGSLQETPAEMLKVLDQALQACAYTEGAFDITVLPVLDLIKKSFKEKKSAPNDGELMALRPLVNCQAVKIEKHKVQLRKGQKISLDGIAKGYAVDKVSQELKSQGIKNFLLNFSGNMKWQGHKADNSSWKIYAWNAVTQKAEQPISLTEGAVASSGAEFNYYSDDKRWHHIIDPRSLHPAQIWASTTVFGPQATVCDILSTAMYTLTTTQIESVLRHYPEYQVWASAPDGKMQLISAKK